YQQVAVYFWPILFFELWRVDLWQEETGRLAFVIPDKYGRAWVKYFEGMSIKPHVNDMYTRVYKPADVEALCPGVFDNAITALTADASGTLHPARSGGWGLRTSISYRALGQFMPWTPAYAGVDGDIAHLEPG
ncbi:MAG: hypothetical protein AAFV59_12050, partial [Pseudomonadota bacterium]